MKSQMKWIVALAAVLFLMGCGGSKAIKEGPPCSLQYEQARKKYDAGKYDDAKESLQKILYRCSGSGETAKIMFYLGMSYFHLEKYDQAEYQFRDLVRDFHTDSLAERSQYMISKCLFSQSRSPDRDQTETKKALTEFKIYLDEYPGGAFADSAGHYVAQCNDKIAQKEFMNGRLYSRMQEYKAAIIYFKDLLAKYGDSRWALPAQYELAQALGEENKTAEALELCNNLLSRELPDDLRQKTQKLLTRLSHE